MHEVSLNQNIVFSNNRPFCLIVGINVLESFDLAHQVASFCRDLTQKLDIPLVFKASFDKANRSSLHSFRGPGLDEGLRWLGEIKKTLDISVITDVHEIDQVDKIAQVADIIQIPAFLCRQTDLIVAAAQTDRVINIKKGQFLAPEDMKHIVRKATAGGNERLLLCERGVSFGYHNLVVDMLGFGVMKELGYPLVFDVTHSLQLPGGLGHAAGGRGKQTLDLAKAGISQKIAGLFLEIHPDPDQAKCDGPCALPMQHLESLLIQLKALDGLIKSQEDWATES